ncbi:MAG: type II secretion system protein [Clostridium sp.]|nr:type II secretion system protein [Clostridium sp.]
MVRRKHNQTAGFSLIEVLVAITILGLVVVPIGSSLVLSFRLNARSGDTLQAQLAVSSAVETIMAEGYNPNPDADYEERFPNVSIEHDENYEGAAYAVTVTALDDERNKLDSISVDTYVRPAPIEEEGDES